MLNESVIKVLKNGMWDLATCANGEPNVVPVAFKDVTDDGKLVVGDVFLETTLKDRDDVLNVFIHGNMPEKMKRICQLYNVSEQDAVKMMTDTDKRRMTNYNFYTDQRWGKASNYTLCLNSSQLGYDKCEEIIMECVK